LIGMLTIGTRSVSEEERCILADASGSDDPLLAVCATFRSWPWGSVGVTVTKKGGNMSDQAENSEDIGKQIEEKEKSVKDLEKDERYARKDQKDGGDIYDKQLKDVQNRSARSDRPWRS